MTEQEVIQFDDLSPHLLLQNGNYLYKVPFGDGWAVLKVYYGSRGTWGRLTKSFSNVVLYGQTSYMPKTRCRCASGIARPGNCRRCPMRNNACGFSISWNRRVPLTTCIGRRA